MGSSPQRSQLYCSSFLGMHGSNIARGGVKMKWQSAGRFHARSTMDARSCALDAFRVPYTLRRGKCGSSEAREALWPPTPAANADALSVLKTSTQRTDDSRDSARTEYPTAGRGYGHMGELDRHSRFTSDDLHLYGQTVRGDPIRRKRNSAPSTFSTRRRLAHSPARFRPRARQSLDRECHTFPMDTSSQ